MKFPFSFLTALFLIWTGSASSAIYNYSFECGTNNSAANCSQSEAYLGLAVEDTALGASFTLTNSGPNISHIKKVWIDDDLGILDILSSPGTSPSQSAGVDFSNFSESTRNIGGLGFQAEGEARKNGAAANGVTSGVIPEESLSYDFALTGTNTFNMLIAALNAGTFNVGVHVGSYYDGGSEKLSISTIPVPAAFWLFGTALIGFIGLSRRTKI